MWSKIITALHQIMSVIDVITTNDDFFFCIWDNFNIVINVDRKSRWYLRKHHFPLFY